MSTVLPDSTAPSAPAWPDGLLLTYYGDDFTGSTDVMEAFTAAGVPTVLFLRPPTVDWLQRFPDVRCVGLAGQSRGRSPEWMAHELPTALASKRVVVSLGPPGAWVTVNSTGPAMALPLINKLTSNAFNFIINSLCKLII